MNNKIDFIFNFLALFFRIIIFLKNVLLLYCLFKIAIIVSADLPLISEVQFSKAINI